MSMVLQQFNWVHILVLLTIPLFLISSWLLLKNKSQGTKDKFMWVLMIIVALAYIITFTIDTATDADHRARILARLPLHLCGINMFLYPLCFALRSKGARLKHIVFGYMYFVGSPGALLGSLMPPGPDDIIGQSIFVYNSISYFVRHNLIFIIPVLLVVLGYYKPKAKDMPIAAGTILGLATVMHVVNVVFSAIGGYRVNYFFTRFADNEILEIFWNIVPVELLYLYTLVVVLIPIFAVFYFASFLKSGKSLVFLLLSTFALLLSPILAIYYLVGKVKSHILTHENKEHDP